VKIQHHNFRIRMMVKRMLKRYVESFHGLPKTAWLLSLVVLINHCGSMVIFFLPLYLTGDRGFSVMTAGRIISLWGFGSLIGSYTGGWLSDRWGSKAVQMASLILSGAGYIFLGYLDSLGSIAALVFVLAVVANAVRPANIAAFSEMCAGETQARGFALMRLAVNLGFSVGPALGGILATHSYRYLFWANGLTSLAAAAVLEWVFKGPVSKASESGPSKPPPPWRDGPLLKFLGLLLLVGIVFFQIFGTWPLYMRRVCGFSESGIGLLLTINALMIVLFEMQLIHRIESHDPLSAVSLGVIFMAAGFALLPFMKGYGYVALTVVLWTIGEMLIFPLSATFIAGRASAANSGAYMGLFTLTFSLAMMISPITGTWVYNRFGPQVLWFGAGSMGLLVWAGLKGFGRSARSRRAEKAVPAPVLSEIG
jgi:MFS family permease